MQMHRLHYRGLQSEFPVLFLRIWLMLSENLKDAAKMKRRMCRASFRLYKMASRGELSSLQRERKDTGKLRPSFSGA